VTTVVVDFEAAMWTAVQRVMPNVHLRGCFFHYAQAVWRKIQDLGWYFDYVTSTVRFSAHVGLRTDNVILLHFNFLQH